jgi:hypothetical protein
LRSKRAARRWNSQSDACERARLAREQLAEAEAAIADTRTTTFAVTALVDGLLEHRTLDALPVATADIALSRARAAVEQATALEDGIADELRNLARRLHLQPQTKRQAIGDIVA